MTRPKRIAVAIITGVLLMALIFVGAAKRHADSQDFAIIAAAGGFATSLYVYAMWTARPRQ